MDTTTYFNIWILGEDARFASEVINHNSYLSLLDYQLINLTQKIEYGWNEKITRWMTGILVVKYGRNSEINK